MGYGRFGPGCDCKCGGCAESVGLGETICVELWSIGYSNTDYIGNGPAGSYRYFEDLYGKIVCTYNSSTQEWTGERYLCGTLFQLRILCSSSPNLRLVFTVNGSVPTASPAPSIFETGPTVVYLNFPAYEETSGTGVIFGPPLRPREYALKITEESCDPYIISNEMFHSGVGCDDPAEIPHQVSCNPISIDTVGAFTQIHSIRSLAWVGNCTWFTSYLGNTFNVDDGHFRHSRLVRTGGGTGTGTQAGSYELTLYGGTWVSSSPNVFDPYSFVYAGEGSIDPHSGVTLNLISSSGATTTTTTITLGSQCYPIFCIDGDPETLTVTLASSDPLIDGVSFLLYPIRSFRTGDANPETIYDYPHYHGRYSDGVSTGIFLTLSMAKMNFTFDDYLDGLISIELSSPTCPTVGFSVTGATSAEISRSCDPFLIEQTVTIPASGVCVGGRTITVTITE